MKTSWLSFLILILSVASAGAQDKLVIGGSGSLNEEISEITKAFLARNPNDAVEVRPESMSTTGGIEGVQAGRLTVGLITRRLQDSEKSKLVYRALARSVAVVTVNKTLALNNLTEAQICDLFSGKISSWKDVGGGEGKVTVLTRKRDDSNAETFRNKMACFKNLAIAPDALVLTRGSEVLAAIDKRPGTVAMTNMGSTFKEHENLKALAINNVSPSPENARTDKYKFYHEHGIVTLGEPQGLTRRFLDFVYSPEGQKLLSTHGAIPVR